MTPPQKFEVLDPELVEEKGIPQALASAAQKFVAIANGPASFYTEK